MRFDTAGEFAQAIARAAGPDPGADLVITTDALQHEAVLLLVTADGRRFPVHRGGTTIGRDAVNDIVLPYRQVSRRHAQIECSQAGCTVVDMGSTNGTFINGTPIGLRSRCPLGPGDQLGIGPIVLKATRPATSGQPDGATSSVGFGGI